jgi:hypothetical protein
MEITERMLDKFFEKYNELYTLRVPNGGFMLLRDVFRFSMKAALELDPPKPVLCKNCKKEIELIGLSNTWRHKVDTSMFCYLEMQAEPE